MPEQEKLVETLSKSYWLTTNEKREAVGYGVDENNVAMNEYLVPSGLSSIEDLNMEVDEDVAFPVQEPVLPEQVVEDVIQEEEIEEIIEEEEEKSKVNKLLSFEDAKKELKLRKKDADTETKNRRK